MEQTQPRGSGARSSFHAESNLREFGGYSKFQKQNSQRVKRESVTNLREAFESSNYIPQQGSSKIPVKSLSNLTRNVTSGDFENNVKLSKSREYQRKTSLVDSNCVVTSTPDGNYTLDTSIPVIKSTPVDFASVPKSTNISSTPIGKSTPLDSTSAIESICIDSFAIAKSTSADTTSAAKTIQEPNFVIEVDSSIDNSKVNSLTDTHAISSKVNTLTDTHVITNNNTSHESVQNRLSKSQTVIEKLQQDLPTKLSPAAIEVLKQKYSPAPEKKSVKPYPLNISDRVEHDNKSKSPLTSIKNSFKTIATREKSNVKSAKNSQLSTTDEKSVSFSKSNDDERIRAKTVKKELETSNGKVLMSDYQQKNPEKSTKQQSESAKQEALSKPARVSWTTTLLQKLSQDKPEKKVKKVVLKAQPRVRFPERRNLSVEERFKKHGTPTVAKKETISLISGNKNISNVDSPQITEALVEKEPVFVKRSDLVNDSEKDAYANLVTKLSTGDEDNTARACDINKNTKEEVNKNSDETEVNEDVFDYPHDIHRAQPAAVQAEIQLIKDQKFIFTSEPVERLTADRQPVKTATNRNEERDRGGGLRKLLSLNLFSAPKSNSTEDRKYSEKLSSEVTKERHKSAPSPNQVLETAFISESSRKNNGFVVNAPIDQYNFNKPARLANTAHLRSKSLSPIRKTPPVCRPCTIPDTSLILEERLKVKRQEQKSVPVQEKPNKSAPVLPIKREPLYRVRSPTTPVNEVPIYENIGYVGPNQHSTPKYVDESNDQLGRLRSSISSNSSTSTVVPQEHYQSWKPLLEQRLIIPSSPIVRQTELRPRIPGYHSPQTVVSAKQPILRGPIQHYEPFLVQNHSVPSGRISAPPVSNVRSGIVVPQPRRPAIQQGLLAPVDKQSRSRSVSPNYPLLRQPQSHSISSQSSCSPNSTASSHSQVQNKSPQKLTRQQIEALYLQGQRLRSMSCEHFSPSVTLRHPEQDPKRTSLPRHLSSTLSLQQQSSRPNNFVRGTAERNTIGPIRTSQTPIPGYVSPTGPTQPRIPGYATPIAQIKTSQPHIPGYSTPTIYENMKHQKGNVSKKSPGMIPQPIFKRGSLISGSVSSVDGAATDSSTYSVPKRVSFTGTEKRRSGDSDVFLPNSPLSPKSERAPNRPLPPIPSRAVYGVISPTKRREDIFIDRAPSPASFSSQYGNKWYVPSDTESGSEAEVQRILHQANRRGQMHFRFPEEEWTGDGKSRGPGNNDQSAPSSGRDDEVRRGGGGRPNRREDPRRHTLSGDHHQGGSLARSMDLEAAFNNGQMSSKSQRRKSPLPRGYPPPSSAMLFDDDPGIMSEVETSSTGFRRGGKQRSSLPVVRTPSKTLERPLGLVFLQYRNETKRALLPNEITSIDTVKALFVRSFPKQLTMEYLDSPHVKIYIHDSSKDMFYELEDHRSHLREIRDRSVLRLFESADVNGGVIPGPGIGVISPAMWDQDQSYFSEPEFDSEYQHQHIHKSKASKSQPYYMTHSYPPGGAPQAGTVPRGGTLLRAYSPGVIPPLSAERLKTLPQTAGPGYEDPYYSQYGPRSGSITPVIDEEARIRVEHMERQLANLTGLVQKALTQTPPPREFLQVPASPRDANYRNDKSVSFEKSVSFSDEPPDMNSPKQHSPQHTERTDRERHKPAPPPKPISLSPGQYEGRHVYRDLQLTPEMYNQLRSLQKKAKDLKQEVRNLRRMSQTQAHTVRETIRDTFIKIRAMLLMGGEDAWSAAGDADKVRLSREEDSYKQEMLRLEKDLTELETTVEELRSNVINRKTRVNMSDVENMALILSKSSKTVADLKVRFPNLQEGMKALLTTEMEKVVREEKFLKEEPDRLESALRRCKKLTGTLVTLKRLASVQEQRIPSTSTDPRLSPTLGAESDTPITPPAHSKSSAISTRGFMASSVGSDSSLSRQRPENALDALLDELQTFARPPANPGHNPMMAEIGRKGSMDSSPLISGNTSSLRRLHSYPSSSDGNNSPPSIPLSRLQVSGPVDHTKPSAVSPKPPVPERNSELLSHIAGRRVPPPPPPRTSSRSPLASPTSPSLPIKGQPQMGSTLLRRGAPGRSSLREPLRGIGLESKPSTEEPSQQGHLSLLSASNSSSCESINSQEGVQGKTSINKARQEILEQRHQELLRKQRALQEQYARLQQLQRGAGAGLVPPPDLLLKKTGSESNLLAKMGLGHGLSAAAPISGSLTHLAAVATSNPQLGNQKPAFGIITTTPSATATTTSVATDTDISLATTTTSIPTTAVASTTTSKIYETDIL